MNRHIFSTIFCLAAVLGICAGAQEAVSAGAIIENSLARLEIAPHGHVLHLIDKASGTDYLKSADKPAFALVKKGGKQHPASKASFAGGVLSLEFESAGATADIAVTAKERYFLFEVAKLTGAGVEELTFVHAPLTLAGRLDEPFAGCALALNLQTNVAEIPGPNAMLRALCSTRFGCEGAAAAIIACPMPVLRDIMKEAVSAAKDLPRSDIGGPWALDAPKNRGSYLFDFGNCTEETVDDWIALVKRLGLNQIDFHTGKSLRFGDCHPDPELFPRGRASVKAVIDKLHAAGISAGLHTYAFFMAKSTPFVTPVPDPGLGKFASFTLAEDLPADGDRVAVEESTKDVSNITGFFVRNSVTVQIDDELIVFKDTTKEPPYAFTSCTRGAYGTKAAPHGKGAKVHHIKECFGLFAPDPDSELLTKVATCTADTFNECGFDMIYLDALDGEDILGGRENSWHYGSKFVFEIANRLKKPALFEMSTFHHHLWYVRARMGAWDHPNRSHKRFIDNHAAANQAGAKMFLPMNLGWWAVKDYGGAEREPTFPDDIEYLMCKCLGNGMGLALMGVNPGNIDQVPAYKRLAPIFRQYEDLRHAGYFPEAVKARLRVPGDEFTLEQDEAQKWRFREVKYVKHRFSAGAASRWTTNNTFKPQPVQLRIEALQSVAPYASADGVAIETFGDTAVYDSHQALAGVTSALTSKAAQECGVNPAPGLPADTRYGVYTASTPHATPKNTWVKFARPFTPELNISKQHGLGLWVHGDGSGAILNVQVKSPEHIAGGICDRYVDLDFTGWRYMELVEPEGGRASDFGWPYGGNGYGIYRESVNYGHIDGLSLWYTNLPKDKEVKCLIGPVKALPLVDSALRNPKVTLGGKTITFPTEIKTGCYLEFRSMTDCTLYGPKGEEIAKVTPQGEAPTAASGANTAELACDPDPDVRPRARVTVITRGERL